MALYADYAKHYTSVIDVVYKRASVTAGLNFGRKLVRAGRGAREIMVPRLTVSSLGDYVRNSGYKTGMVTLNFETKAMNYDRGVKLVADVMDLDETGVADCFVRICSELMRTQVAPEADAFTFAQIASHDGVGASEDDYEGAEADDVLADLRSVTSRMDEDEVTAGTRYLFVTPTIKGLIDDFSQVNPTRSDSVLKRFCRVVEVPQTRFYTAIDLNTGDQNKFGYQPAKGSYVQTADASVVPGKTYYKQVNLVTYQVVASPTDEDIATYYELKGAGRKLNYVVLEKSALIKFDKHVASRIFSPDELEDLDSYMMKYRKHGIVDLYDEKLAGVHVSSVPA